VSAADVRRDARRQAREYDATAAGLRAQIRRVQQSDAHDAGEVLSLLFSQLDHAERCADVAREWAQ
jgi:hypothetical protein